MRTFPVIARSQESGSPIWEGGSPVMNYPRVAPSVLTVRAFQFQSWGIVLLFTMPGQNRGKPKFPGFHGKEHLKYLIQKIAFDFTAGLRLSENVKIRPQWIYDFCLQQRCNRNNLAANIGPCNLKLVLERCFEL